MRHRIASLLSAGTLFLFDGNDDTGGGGGGGDKKEPVPYERFAEVTRKLGEERTAREAAEAKASGLEADVDKEKKRADAAEQKLTERERESLPEKERRDAELQAAKDAAAAAEAKAEKAEQLRVESERAGWVRAAAAAAGFHDAEDAVLRIKLDEIRTEDGAKRAVEAIATADATKHLVKQPEKKDDTTVSAAEALERVLKDGQRVEGADAENGGGGNGDKPVISAAEFNAMGTDALVALQERDPDLYARSLAAAAASE